MSLHTTPHHDIPCHATLHAIPALTRTCNAVPFLPVAIAAGHEADGVVLKVNDLQAQQLLGAKGSDPEWAMAWKFPASEAATRLTAITLNVGRTGQVGQLLVIEGGWWQSA